MRVIAGKYKNLHLISPKGQSIRPTSDRVREWIFSCFMGQITGIQVLDLFAGTGAFGLEALSRGAESVTFVDQSKQAIDLIGKNLKKAKADSAIFNEDAISFLSRTSEQYDIIFCDPPYRYDQFGTLAEMIYNRKILTKTGILIYETDRHEPIIELSNYTKLREQSKSRTRVMFYQYEF